MSEEEKCIKAFERYVCDHREKYTTMQADHPLRFLAHEYQYFRAAWNLHQQVPDGWREFIENIATVGSEPLNSAVVYRALASRRHFMAELRNKARALLADAPKPEDVK